jgi:Zn-dependent peptidase ImmA (M78 family)
VQQMRIGDWEVEAMRRIARRFRVTPTAAATRALRLGLMRPRIYNIWKDAWAAYQTAYPDRPGFGIATPAEKAVACNGPLLTSLVLSALSNEQISSTDAAKFLDVGFGHVETLRKGWMERPTALVGE